MGNFFVFIDDPKIMAKPKKILEDLIVDCSAKVLGKKYYGGYYDLFGDKSGLGKTYDKCYSYGLEEFPGVTVHSPEKMNSIFDVVFDYMGETIALQIKTSHEYDKNISLARISDIGDTEKKKEAYKNKVRNRMVGENISKFYLPYTTISDGKTFLYLIAEIIDNKFIYYPDDASFYRSSEKQTGLTLNIECLKVVKYKKAPGLYTVEKQNESVPNKKLKSFSQLKDDSIKVSKMFNNSNKLILGEKWGDKGLGYESFLVKYLLKTYKNISLPKKKTSFVDFIVDELSAVQLKTSSTKYKELWPTFGRSSTDDLSILEHNWDHRFLDDPIPVPYKRDKSIVRCGNVKERLTTDIIDSKQKEYNLLSVDLYREDVDVFTLASLYEDKTLKCHGSFLKNGFYRSKGGENGNQTHFRIKMKNLVSSIEDNTDSMFEFS